MLIPQPFQEYQAKHEKRIIKLTKACGMWSACNRVISKVSESATFRNRSESPGLLCPCFRHPRNKSMPLASEWRTGGIHPPSTQQRCPFPKCSSQVWILSASKAPTHLLFRNPRSPSSWPSGALRLFRCDLWCFKCASGLVVIVVPDNWGSRRSLPSWSCQDCTSSRLIHLPPATSQV